MRVGQHTATALINEPSMVTAVVSLFPAKTIPAESPTNIASIESAFSV
jgi:hypothetical protein